MKKIIALVLSLCLLCGAGALAETTQTGSTKVTYTITTSESYTLTVPASASLNQNEGGPTGYMDVTLDATNFNVSGKTISVALTGAAFKLSNGTDEIAYTLKYGTNKGNQSGTVLNLNDTILTWTYGNAATVTTDVRINVSSSEVTGKTAGEYSDTLTFTASVSGGVTVDGWEDGGDLGGGEASEG